MIKKLLRHCSAALLLLLGSVSMSSQAQQAQPLPIDPAIRMGKLPNGLTYFIRHNEQPKDRAHFYITQRVGSMQEEDSQSGLAHFLEHMAFNGTKNFPNKDIIHYLEKNGIRFGSNLNAYTGFDETVYQIMDAPTTRTSFVDSCLLILHDWSNALTLSDKEIDNERGVIQEEWRSRESANLRAYSKLMKIAFPDGQYYGKRMPIGDMDVVRNFEYKELRDYYHRWYRPDLQGIIVVGDIDVDYIEGKIKEYFSGIKLDPNAAERIYHQVPDHEAPISIVVTDPELTSTQFSLMIHSDAESREVKASSVAPMIDYLKSVISAMMSYRFAEITEKPNAPFRYAGLRFGDYIIATTEESLDLDVVAFEGKYKEAMDVAVAELKRAAEHGFTASEYDRVRTELKTQYENLLKAKDNRTNGQFAQQISDYFSKGGYLLSIEHETAILNNLADQIPVEFINNMLKQLVHLGSLQNYTLSLIAPEKDGLTYPDDAGLLREFEAALAQDVEPYHEEVSDQKLMEELPKGGQIASEEKEDKFGATVLTLTNGVKVYLLPTDHKKNQVSLRGISAGGTSLMDLSSDDITPRALDYATVGGISTFSPTALSKVLVGRQASASTSISESTESVSGSSSTQDIETMLQLVYLNMTSVRVDDELFTAAIQRSKARLESAKANPLNSVLSDSLPSLINPDNIMAHPLTAEQLEMIDYSKVVAAHNARFANGGDFTFFVIGDFDLETIKPLIAQYLGALTNTGVAEKVDLTNLKGTAKVGRTTHFDLPMATPVATNIDIFVMDTKYDLRSRLIFDIISEVLNQQYLVSIREEEGGTYGVSTQSNVERYPSPEGSLLIYFQSDPNNAIRLNDRIKAEYDEMVQKGINTEFFEKTILNLQKQHQESLKQNGYWLGKMIQAYIYGEYEDFDSVLQSIKPEDVQQMMKELKVSGRYFELMAKGVEKK